MLVAVPSLVSHRKERSRIDEDTIEIEGSKHRPKISPAKRAFLRAVLVVLAERRDFWPLTARQIHYALLNNPPLIHASKPSGSTRYSGILATQLCQSFRALLHAQTPSSCGLPRRILHFAKMLRDPALPRPLQ